jgi:acetyl-CoA carboxylase biotin carboxylase subunit
MRAVWKEEELLSLGRRASRIGCTGNDGMYLEKLIEEPRHIEIQVVGDSYGKACHLSERDCRFNDVIKNLLKKRHSIYDR